MDYTTLIPPAIALSVLIFFIKFFGKVIADQKPFSDDRDWEIELNGFYFVLNVISYAIIGVVLALGLKIDFWSHFINLIILTFISLTLSAKSRKMAFNFYDVKSENIPNKNDVEKNMNNFFEKIGDKISIKFIFPILLIVFFILTKDFVSKNLFWIVTFLSQTFIIIFYSAFIYSLTIFKTQKADIFFNDKSINPLRNIVLLKVNLDNIKIKDGKNVVILNKSTILKIVIKPLKINDKNKKTEKTS